MKRWCFDNKNKKNNFYTQRIQSFFLFFFKSFFSFSFFKFYFSNIAILFLLHASPWGNFYALSWFFYAHPHAYTPRFSPRTLKTRALPPPCLFQVVRQFRRFRIFRQFTLLPYNSEFSEHSKMYIYTFPDFTTSKLSEYS